MRKRVLSIFLCTTSFLVLQANAGTTKMLPKEKIGVLLNNFVLQYKAKNVSYPTQPYMESFDVDDSNRQLRLVVSPAFATQNFTEISEEDADLPF